jgi:glycosyltransferase involved in cell wall biosynthesis
MSDKDHNPLISIIVPFFNRQDFLAEAVDSVLGQTYSNWQLLLVDDGSTDTSTDLAKAYSATYPDRIRYLEHEGHSNHGVGASRGLGVRYAQGEWIACLDSDDVWVPHKLQTQIDLLHQHPAARMIVNASEYWYSWTGHEHDRLRDKIIPVGATQDAVTYPPDLLHQLYPLGTGDAPCPASCMVHADVLAQTEGWEANVEVSLRDAYEDQYFLTKVYLVAPVYISSQCLDRYRIIPTRS